MKNIVERDTEIRYYLYKKQLFESGRNSVMQVVA